MFTRKCYVSSMENLTIFPEKTATFLLPGPLGPLEVLTAYPESGAPVGVGIICHPDPRYDGSMQNKVVTTIHRAFTQLGLATVRFNFRGVGLSAGAYGDTHGELADLNRVIAWVRSVLPQVPLWLAGFSFGSYISALGAKTAHPVRLVSIAPAVTRHDFTQFTNMNCPWLVVHGDQDEVVPYESVRAWADHPPSPLQLIVMPGATHFFHGRLIELCGHIERWANMLK
jgi:uncharacterized protein